MSYHYHQLKKCCWALLSIWVTQKELYIWIRETFEEGYLGVGKIPWYWFISHKVYSYSYIIKVKNTTFPWLNTFWKTLHIISLECFVFSCISQTEKSQFRKPTLFLFGLVLSLYPSSKLFDYKKLSLSDNYWHPLEQMF